MEEKKRGCSSGKKRCQEPFRAGSREKVPDTFSSGHVIEAVLGYIESHHWIFGLAALGYIFYLHDRAIHARFDAIDKRIDGIRKPLAIEY